MPKKIMLVDNDKFYRDYLSGLLSEEGFEVESAKDGIEVLEKIDSVKPDAIVLDLVLENFDGDQVISFLKRNRAYQNIPIILLSGVAKSHLDEAKNLDADIFIPKGDEESTRLALIKGLNTLLRNGGGQRTPEPEREDSKKDFHDTVIMELLKRSKNFQTILNNLSEGILATNEELKITYSNECTGKILGLGPEKILGREIKEFLAVIDTSPKVIDSFDDVAKMKSRQKVFEIFYRDKVLKCRASFLKKGRKINGAFLVIIDMTEQKSLQNAMEEEFKKRTEELENTYKELQKTNFELIKAGEIKSQFVANVSHELRSPLNDIMGFVQLMQAKIYGPTSEKQDEALMHIMQNSKSLLKMINEILDVTKLDKDEMPICTSSIHPRELIEQVIGSYSWIGEAKEIEIKVFYSDNLPVIETDDSKLKRILLNLLDNAVKFTDQGYILLKVMNFPDEEKIEFTVEDTGIGISPQETDLIFQPFRQIDGSSTRQYGGVGLGLYIVKKLVEMLKGTISIESRLEKGTIFRLKFPYTMEEK